MMELYRQPRGNDLLGSTSLGESESIRVGVTWTGGRCFAVERVNVDFLCIFSGITIVLMRFAMAYLEDDIGIICVNVTCWSSVASSGSSTDRSTKRDLLGSVLRVSFLDFFITDTAAGVGNVLSALAGTIWVSVNW